MSLFHPNYVENDTVHHQLRHFWHSPKHHRLSAISAPTRVALSRTAFLRETVPQMAQLLIPIPNAPALPDHRMRCPATPPALSHPIQSRCQFPAAAKRGCHIQPWTQQGTKGDPPVVTRANLSLKICRVSPSLRRRYFLLSSVAPRTMNVVSNAATSQGGSVGWLNEGQFAAAKGPSKSKPTWWNASRGFPSCRLFLLQVVPRTAPCSPSWNTQAST